MRGSIHTSAGCAADAWGLRRGGMADAIPETAKGTVPTVSRRSTRRWSRRSEAAVFFFFQRRGAYVTQSYPKAVRLGLPEREI